MTKALTILTCAFCQPQKTLTDNIYQIIERNEHGNGYFCSLLCIENHLAKNFPDWAAISVVAEIPNGVRTKPIVHYVRTRLKSRAKLYNDRVA